MGKDVIMVTRGMAADMNRLMANELGVALDTMQLFVGTGNGAEPVLIRGEKGDKGDTGEKGEDAPVTTESVISDLAERSYATPVQIGRWLDGKPVYRVYYEEEIDADSSVFAPDNAEENSIYRTYISTLLSRLLSWGNIFNGARLLDISANCYNEDIYYSDNDHSTEFGLNANVEIKEGKIYINLADYLGYLSGKKLYKNTCYGYIDFSCHAGYVTGEWDFGNIALDDWDDWYHPAWECNDLSFLQVDKTIKFTVSDSQILTKNFAIHVPNSDTHYLNIHHTENFEAGHVYSAVITVAPSADSMIDGEATVVTDNGMAVST